MHSRYFVFSSSYVLSITIQGYKYYAEAVSLPEDCRFLTIRLQIEQQRFLNFALESGLLCTDANLCDALRVNRSLLLAVLAEAQNLFEQCAHKHGKYEVLLRAGRTSEIHQDAETDLIELLCAPPNYISLPNSHTEQRSTTLHKLGKGLARSGRNLRKVVVEPKRLVWATLDKGVFERFVGRLAELNSFLIALLDGSQAKRLQHAMDVSYQEILHIRNDIASLTNLLEALRSERKASVSNAFQVVDRMENPISRSAAEESKIQERKRSYLLKLTEIKIQLSRLYDQSDDFVLPTKREISLAGIELEDTKQNDDTFRGRSNAHYEGNAVWIEWKGLPYSLPEVGSLSERQHQLVETRIRLLVELLCEDKPEGFRSPPCLGYVRATVEGELRYGIIFKKASSRDPCPIRLRTLHEILQERPKPSLSARISLCTSLAKCVYSFHSVDWLHKGLRSENILFLQPQGAQANIYHPQVTGFELSRPSEFEGMSEQPAYNPVQDIYRHPLAQSMQGGGKFRKVYDIYALGILLIEIANWKRIDALLGFQDISAAKPRELRDAHRKLLDDPTQWQRLASKSGDAFAEVVRWCLTSDELSREWNGSPVSLAMQLQGQLEEVLSKLRTMEAAIGAGTSAHEGLERLYCD